MKVTFLMPRPNIIKDHDSNNLLIPSRNVTWVITAFTYEPWRAKTYRLTCSPNNHSNQHAHLRSLIRAFIVRMKKLCIRWYPKCAKRRFWSDCANAQADLNLRWTHISKGTFPCVMVLIILSDSNALYWLWQTYGTLWTLLCVAK